MRLDSFVSIICFLLISVYSVKSQDPYSDELHHPQRHHAKRVPSQSQQMSQRNVRKVFAMCPPTFVKIGNECYHLSASQASWLDAHFDCKDKNAKLAEPVKSSDRILRKFLIERGLTRGFIWIGGMYNWQRFKWQWGYNGKEMTYQSFSRMAPGEDLKYSCAVLNPELKYRWSAKKCFEKHYYLCQHPMPFVGERAREKVFTKWNETYPGQFANEVQVFVTSNGTNRSEFYRAATPRRHNLREHANNNNHRSFTSNEINPPEVLANRDSVMRSKLRRNKKQQVNRENKSLMRTRGNDIIDRGEMDMSRNSALLKKQRKQMRHGKKWQKHVLSMIETSTMPTWTSTTEHSNYISQYFHPHRHNHQSSERERELTQETETTTTLMTSNTPPLATSTAIISNAITSAADLTTSSTSMATSTSSVVVTEGENLSVIALKQLEKKRRLEKIRQKLSKLTDEEKLEFLRLKAQRKKEKHLISNDAIPEV